MRALIILLFLASPLNAQVNSHWKTVTDLGDVSPRPAKVESKEIDTEAIAIPRSIRNGEDAICKITFHHGSSSFSSGSGCIIEGGAVVTCAHAFRDPVSRIVCETKNDRFEATVIYSDIVPDIAILKPTRKPKSNGMPVAQRDFQNIAFYCGFPGGKGFQACAGQKSSVGDTKTLILGGSNFGMSGGPVFNRNGELVGNVSGDTHDGHVRELVASQYRFLRRAIETAMPQYFRGEMAVDPSWPQSLEINQGPGFNQYSPGYQGQPVPQQQYCPPNGCPPVSELPGFGRSIIDPRIDPRFGSGGQVQQDIQPAQPGPLSPGVYEEVGPIRQFFPPNRQQVIVYPPGNRGATDGSRAIPPSPSDSLELNSLKNSVSGLEDKVARIERSIAERPELDLSKFATKSDLSQFVTKSDLSSLKPDLSQYAKRSEIPNPNQFATPENVDQKISSLAEASQASIENAVSAVDQKHDVLHQEHVSAREKMGSLLSAAGPSALTWGATAVGATTPIGIGLMALAWFWRKKKGVSHELTRQPQSIALDPMREGQYVERIAMPTSFIGHSGHFGTPQPLVVQAPVIPQPPIQYLPAQQSPQPPRERVIKTIPKTVKHTTTTREETTQHPHPDDQHLVGVHHEHRGQFS